MLHNNTLIAEKDLREKLEDLSQKDVNWVLKKDKLVSDRQTLWLLKLLTEPKIKYLHDTMSDR